MGNLLKKYLDNYALARNEVNAEHFKCHEIVDKIIQRAHNHSDYCERAYKWLKGDECTLLLRELAREVGYDYWKNINNSNAIDRIEIAWMNMKGNK